MLLGQASQPQTAQTKQPSGGLAGPRLPLLPPLTRLPTPQRNPWPKMLQTP